MRLDIIRYTDEFYIYPQIYINNFNNLLPGETFLF